MKKSILVAALLGITTLVNANNSNSGSYTLVSGLNCNNSSYNCSVPVSNISPDYQISDCTFTFTQVNSKSHGYNSGYLSCDLYGSQVNCQVGTQKGSTTTWTCTLNQSQIDCMNSCLTSGQCNFGIYCQGDWNIGSCCVNYDCTPCPKRTVPDGSTTLYLLGAALLGLEAFRRFAMPAKALASK